MGTPRRGGAAQEGGHGGPGGRGGSREGRSGICPGAGNSKSRTIPDLGGNDFFKTTTTAAGSCIAPRFLVSACKAAMRFCDVNTQWLHREVVHLPGIQHDGGYYTYVQSSRLLIKRLELHPSSVTAQDLATCMHVAGHPC